MGFADLGVMAGLNVGLGRGVVGEHGAVGEEGRRQWIDAGRQRTRLALGDDPVRLEVHEREPDPVGILSPAGGPRIVEVRQRADQQVGRLGDRCRRERHDHEPAIRAPHEIGNEPCLQSRGVGLRTRVAVDQGIDRKLDPLGRPLLARFGEDLVGRLQDGALEGDGGWRVCRRFRGLRAGSGGQQRRRSQHRTGGKTACEQPPTRKRLGLHVLSCANEPAGRPTACQP